MLLTIDERGSKIDRNSVFYCHLSAGDKWQSKTLFLTILDLCSSIVLTFSIAAYLVHTNNFYVSIMSWTILPRMFWTVLVLNPNQ